MFKNILMVCVGNICRSPMAEAIFKDEFQKKSIKDVMISSAGIGAVVGHGADVFVKELLAAEGIDCSQHIARQITNDMIVASDLILVMENAHRQEIERIQPSACGKVHLLGKWEKIEIPDPYKKPREVFEETFRLVKKSALGWQTKLWN